MKEAFIWGLLNIKERVRERVGYLVDDIDAIGELLALEEGVQVIEQQAKVVLPGTVGHDYGCSGARLTPCRTVPAPRFHPGVPSHNLGY